MYFPRGFYQSCRTDKQDYKRMERIHARRKIHLSNNDNVDSVCNVRLYGNSKRMTRDIAQVTCKHCQSWAISVIKHAQENKS
jgi:hypothetical protein